MRNYKKYIYYTYLVSTIVIFLGIIVYILLVRSTYDTATETRLTVFDKGMEASELLKTELTTYFSIRTELEWEQRKNNSKIVKEARKDLYGDYYNALFYSKNPTYRVTDTYISYIEPYIVTLEITLTDSNGSVDYTVQGVIEGGYITNIKVF